MQLPKLKLVLPRVEWSSAALLAIATGCGAAVGSGLLPSWLLLLLIPLLFLLPLPRSLLVIAGVAASGISGWFQAHELAVRQRDYGDSFSRISGIVRICDSRCTEAGGVSRPYYYRAFVQKPGCAEIPVLAALPDNFPAPFFGDNFQIDGILMPPEISGFHFDGQRISGELPSPYGNEWRLRIERARLLPPTTGLRRNLLKIREKLLSRLLSRLQDEEIRSMAARLFFGASAGASAEVKARFVLSGTIHLFAVSGMHVAVLALLLLRLLRPLPFALRHWLTAAGVALYVGCIGFPLPALRAGTMIVVWALLRSFFLLIPGWRILLLTWSLLMICDPAAVGDLGTQYSFLITAVLLLVSMREREWNAAQLPEQPLIPPRQRWAHQRRSRWNRWRRSLLMVLATGAAFFGGCGISLARQHLFLPGSLAANLFLPLLMPLLFGVMFFKLLAGSLWSGSDRLGAWLLEKLFDLLTGGTELVSRIFPAWSAAEPPWFEVILAGILLLAALSARRFRPALFCGGAALLLVISWPLRQFAEPASVTVVSSAAEYPPLIAFRPASGGRGYLLNAPDRWSCHVAGEWLAGKGWRDAEIGFSGGTVRNCGGLDALRRRIGIAAVHWPEGRTSPVFRRIAGGELNGNYLTGGPAGVFHVEQNDSGLVWPVMPGLRIIVGDGDEGRRVRVEERGRERWNILIPWCSVPLLWSAAVTP